MSNYEFSISREHFKTIMQFVDLMSKNMYDINKLPICLLLFRIEGEMKQYKNKGCDAVVKMCKEMRTTLYKNGEAIVQALIRFSNAVNEVVSDEVFYSVYSI